MTLIPEGVMRYRAFAALVLSGLAVFAYGHERHRSRPEPDAAVVEFKKTADAAVLKFGEAVNKFAALQNPLAPDPHIPLTDPAEQEAALRTGIEKIKESAEPLKEALVLFKRAGNDEAFRKAIEGLRTMGDAARSASKDLERREGAKRAETLEAEKTRLEAESARLEAELERVKAELDRVQKVAE